MMQYLKKKGTDWDRMTLEVVRGSEGDEQNYLKSLHKKVALRISSRFIFREVFVLYAPRSFISDVGEIFLVRLLINVLRRVCVREIHRISCCRGQSRFGLSVSSKETNIFN